MLTNPISLRSLLAMKRASAIFIAIALLASMFQSSATAVVKAGVKCKTARTVNSSSGKKYICAKLGKKLVWKKVVEKASKTSNSSATSKSENTQILKEGNPCKPVGSLGVKIEGGILYCVQISDGSYKYIEHFKAAPLISNPQSPEPLEACETPDLRGPIPSQMSFLAITHDSVVPSSPLLKHSGTLNLLVVPIDFSDAIGKTDPESVYRKDFDTLSRWFSVNSNNKLNVVIDLKNKWFRAPLAAAKYDPALLQPNDYETQRKLVQDYVTLTSPEIDYSKADTVVFVYPKSASNSTGYLSMWHAEFNTGNSLASFSVLSSIGTADKYEPFWQWLAHEMLHSMGLAMHFPADPPGWGVEWGRYSFSEALLPWNQMIFDWINPDQYYCVSAKNLTQTNLTLVPQESELPGMRTIFVRVSNSEVLMVVSYRDGIWAYDTPDDFYGTMVAIIDTSKQLDWSGEFIDDKFDGVKYSRPGVWLHPDNQVENDNSWTNEHTGEGGALMYLGDSITYKGVKIKLVKSNNFDTLELSRT